MQETITVPAAPQKVQEDISPPTFEEWLQLEPTKGEFSPGDLVIDTDGNRMVVESNLSVQYGCVSEDGNRFEFYRKVEKQLRRRK